MYARLVVSYGVRLHLFIRGVMKHGHGIHILLLLVSKAATECRRLSHMIEEQLFSSNSPIHLRSKATLAILLVNLLVRTCEMLHCSQVKSLGYEPVVVLSQADRECAECKTNTLGDFPALNDLKIKVHTANHLYVCDFVMGNVYHKVWTNWQYSQPGSTCMGV